VVLHHLPQRVLVQGAQPRVCAAQFCHSWRSQEEPGGARRGAMVPGIKEPAQGWEDFSLKPLCRCGWPRRDNLLRGQGEPPCNLHSASCPGPGVPWPAKGQILPWG
jgi:hypothetical protein